MTPFSMVRDNNGYNSFATPFNDPTYTYSATLAASTATSLTIPEGESNTRWLAIIKYDPGSNVWVAKNDTASGPVGFTFDQTSSHKLPAPKTVKAGDVLSFFTTASGVEVGVELYAL